MSRSTVPAVSRRGLDDDDDGCQPMPRRDSRGIKSTVVASFLIMLQSPDWVQLDSFTIHRRLHELSQCRSSWSFIVAARYELGIGVR